MANIPKIPGVALILSSLVVDPSETLWGKEDLNTTLEADNHVG